MIGVIILMALSKVSRNGPIWQSEKAVQYALRRAKLIGFLQRLQTALVRPLEWSAYILPASR